jgi:formylglycine-generating enzyme required for sulfatase activity
VTAATVPPGRRGRRLAGAALLALGVPLAAGLGTGKLQPYVRYALARPEERERLRAIHAAKLEVAKDPRAFADSIQSYLRDFGDTGWLKDRVLALRDRPVLREDDVYVLARDRAELVFVPGGTYHVGVPGGDGRSTSQPHDVRLGGYLIDQVEVSNERYERFLAEWQAAGSIHLCGNERADHQAALRRSADPQSGRSPYPDGPVVGVSPWDALEYARFYGRRLPSEDEWEVAATFDPATRAPRPYPWGDQAPSAERPNFANLSFAGFGAPAADGFMALCTQPGYFEFDRSPLGLLDAGGNAAEWCAGDKPLPGKQPLRGGSILTTDPAQARPAARREVDPAAPPADAGFRTVMPFDPEG